MNATRLSAWAQAVTLGKASLDAFAEETGATPTPENEGGWIDSAWSAHWKELKDVGAEEADHDRCFGMWRDAFYQIERPEDDWVMNLEAR